MLILDLKSFRSYVKEKHSIGKEFLSKCARKETVEDILVTSMNGDRKIKQSIRITTRSHLRIRKWNQLSQFR